MEKDEVLAYCPNCKSLHEPGEKSNVDVEIAKFSNVRDGERVYIPFWRFFCNFKVPSLDDDKHKNVKNFIKDGSEGKIFVYIPAADLGPKAALETGAYMTAVNPSYSTTFSFNDALHLNCVKSSASARPEVPFYFLAAETSQGRDDDVAGGFSVEPAHEKLVFLPYYRSEEELTPAL